MTVSPPRILDSPDADSAMVDSANQLLEPEFSEPVSVEPGAMPEEPLESSATPPPLTVPKPRPGPPPPALDIPTPTLDTPYPPLPRLDVEPPKGLVYTPMYQMGIGHVPAPETTDYLDGREARLVLGLAAMAVGFIFTGTMGIVALWAVYGEELFVALSLAIERLVGA